MKSSPYQLAMVAFCVAINMLDGYDVFIMGYALPYLAPEFASPVKKGYLLSAALVGLGVGAIFLARLADVYGRRPALLLGLALNTVSLVLSAVAPNFGVLMTCRFLTGVAVGVIGTVCVITASEVVPASKRSVAVGAVMFGYPLGGFVAGLSGASILSLAGGAWQGLFWLGAAMSGVLLVAAIIALPESPAILRRDASETGQHRYHALAARLNLIDESAAAGAATEPDVREKARLLGSGYRTQTLCLWAGYTFLTAAFYFIGTWTPQLIANASGDRGTGVIAGIMVSIGTMLGALVFGYLGIRRPAALISSVALVVSMIGLVGFALVLQGFLALGLAIVMSACLYMALSAYAGVASAVYPPEARATGYGMMLGIGRVGAIVAPILGGYAVTVMSPNAMYLGVLVPLGLAALVSVVLYRVMRSSSAEESTPSAGSSPASASGAPKSE